MKPRRVQVSHSLTEGFVLTVEEYSRFKAFLSDLSEIVCGLTAHRFCHVLTTGPITWDWKASKDIVRVPIDRAQADALSHSKDRWGWTDEE